MTSLAEIERMTFFEYRLRLRAYELSQVDKERDIHMQAWCNWNVQATKGQGRHKRVSVFKTFKSFFDYEKLINKVLGKNLAEEAGVPVKSIVEGMKLQRERGETDVS